MNKEMKNDFENTAHLFHVGEKLNTLSLLEMILKSLLVFLATSFYTTGFFIVSVM